MSLNIVDTLLDKLSFNSKEINIPFGKKFTGSQNFLGTNQCLSQSIPTEFLTPFMDNDYFSVDHTKMYRSNSLDSKMNNIFHYFDPTSDRLVGRVSKLLSPMLNSHSPFCIAPNYLEILRDPELMKQGFKLLCEEVEQHFEKMNKKQFESKACSVTNSSNCVESDSKKASQVNLNSIPVKVSKQSSVENTAANQTKEINLQVKSKKDQSGLRFSVEISTSPNSVLRSDKNSCHQGNMPVKSPNTPKMAVPQVALQEDAKKPIMNNQTLNEELTIRKNKELQKRSKKRRRRQKKNNQVQNCKAKGNPNTANAGPSNRNTKCSDKRTSTTACADPGTSLTDKTPKSSDIFCDIVRSGVQILLPNSSSFVISIESAEDDSDWDANTDCDWLDDCSEFGLFISNLSAPLSCFSKLSVPSSPCEDIEVHRLGKVLRRVNENWVESMKGLDTKPKVATKVSFAPDDELVEIVQVEVFDRKGEWEMFATERMRFKRRIDDLEKIISPCLSVKHREKILSRLQKSNLIIE